MAFSEALRDSVVEIVDHYNDRHSDSVLFIVQQHLGYTDAIEAQINTIQEDRVCFSVSSASGNIEHEILLPVQISAREQVSENFFSLLRQARTAAEPDVPPTSIEKELKKNASLPTYHATVKSSEWVTPTIRQITFDGLVDLDLPGPDAFLFVMVPAQGDQLPDDFSMADWRQMPIAERMGGAYYTVRAQRGAEVDMWFFVHETYGAVSDWASRAQPGDSVAMWGPRSSFLQPSQDTGYLLMGDETAYPAIAAILDELPADTSVSVLLESNGDIVRMREEPHWQIHWIQRTAGGDNTLMSGLELLQLDEIKDRYVFGAAEASQIRSIRQFLKAQGMPKEQLCLTGYWRQS